MESATLPRVKYAELPGTRLAYNYTQLVPADQDQDINGGVLIAFVNGLGLPQAFWQSTLDILKQEAQTGSFTSRQAVALFTYDRNGQGLSRTTEASMPKLHDVNSAVQELGAMIQFVKQSYLPESSNPKIFLVAHSIGVPLARLYCQQYPQTVTALLALDSNIANTDFVSLMPDPDAPSFNHNLDLPSDTTVEQLRWTRENYRRMFHPSTPNPENLDRSSLATVLPASHSPVLTAPGGDAVLLTVVAHDPMAFAEESLKISTKGLTDHYLQPAWNVYNEGLLELGRSAKGVVIANGSGHFVQRDNPRCVANEIVDLLARMDGTI